jgi:hypothetical protein
MHGVQFFLKKTLATEQAQNFETFSFFQPNVIVGWQDAWGIWV